MPLCTSVIHNTGNKQFFTLYLQTTTIAQVLCIRGERGLASYNNNHEDYKSYINEYHSTYSATVSHLSLRTIVWWLHSHIVFIWSCFYWWNFSRMEYVCSECECIWLVSSWCNVANIHWLCSSTSCTQTVTMNPTSHPTSNSHQGKCKYHQPNGYYCVSQRKKGAAFGHYFSKGRNWSHITVLCLLFNCTTSIPQGFPSTDLAQTQNEGR